MILNRKENEKIRIGDDIVIVIRRIERGRVQFAIEAPPEVPIRRQEEPLDRRKSEDARS